MFASLACLKLALGFLDLYTFLDPYGFLDPFFFFLLFWFRDFVRNAKIAITNHMQKPLQFTVFPALQVSSLQGHCCCRHPLLDLKNKNVTVHRRAGSAAMSDSFVAPIVHERRVHYKIPLALFSMIKVCISADFVAVGWEDVDQDSRDPGWSHQQDAGSCWGNQC